MPGGAPPFRMWLCWDSLNVDNSGLRNASALSDDDDGHPPLMLPDGGAKSLPKSPAHFFLWTAVCPPGLQRFVEPTRLVLTLCTCVWVLE